MWRCAGLLTVLLITGCQSTHDDLLAKGYPPAFADGFDDGCSSGRQAAGSISGEFRKNVPRYLKDPLYAEGWSDGFHQCLAMRDNQDRADYRNSHLEERDKAWQQQKDQDAARAYRSQ
ncbi:MULTISPECIES: hypothetical protein [unclassified Pseudomonas]|jgi:hypothetical protein|uniref:hypothetical protein n=1 Tax=unclassified Pseudomonas TaxID=196821 RepID=UPI00069F4D7D|nr:MULTISPECIES: hypothetical protein [unclassified Pseudomonas]WPN46530.1 hypothetical protein QMK58_25810 [Pseudomonas sp. P8_241]